MAKYIAQILIAGVQVVGRAFTRALRQEMQASNEAASKNRSSREGKREAATNSYTGISIQEAQKILNVPDNSDPELIDKTYKRLFDMNDKQKGGSFYIQSKVVRAKERLDAERASSQQQEDADAREKTNSQTKDGT